MGLLSKAPEGWGGSRAGLPASLSSTSPLPSSGTCSTHPHSQRTPPHCLWLPRARPDLPFLGVPQITNLSLHFPSHSPHPPNPIPLRKAKPDIRGRKRTCHCINPHNACPFLSKTATEFPQNFPFAHWNHPAWNSWNATANYHPIQIALGWS